MKKEDLLIIILFLCLLLAAVLTWLLGGEKSRHGLGASRAPLLFAFPSPLPKNAASRESSRRNDKQMG